MSDLVKQLRHFAEKCGDILETAAADRIEQLEATQRDLVEALEKIDMAGIKYQESPVECVGRLRGIAKEALDKVRNQK